MTEFEVAVDRIEGDVAVLYAVGPIPAPGEPPARLLWPRSLLPAGTREGDHLRVSVAPDRPATDAARERVRGLLDRLGSAGAGRGGKGPTGGGSADK